MLGLRWLPPIIWGVCLLISPGAGWSQKPRSTQNTAASPRWSDSGSEKPLFLRFPGQPSLRSGPRLASIDWESMKETMREVGPVVITSLPPPFSSLSMWFMYEQFARRTVNHSSCLSQFLPNAAHGFYEALELSTEKRERLLEEMIRPSNLVKVIAGFDLGFAQGVGADVKDTLEGLAKMNLASHVYEMIRDGNRAIKETGYAKTWTQERWSKIVRIYDWVAATVPKLPEMDASIIKGLQNPCWLSEHGYEVGVLAGVFAQKEWELLEVLEQPPQERARVMGKIVGYLSTELASLFLLPAAAEKVIPRLVELFKEQRVLKRLLSLVEKEGWLGKLLGRGGIVVSDVGKSSKFGSELKLFGEEAAIERGLGEAGFEGEKTEQELGSSERLVEEEGLEKEKVLDNPAPSQRKSGTLFNSKGNPYPEVIDLKTGKGMPFPEGNLQRVPITERASWTKMDRAQFIKDWYNYGYKSPPGGWELYDIHHIKPLEFGGTNDFDNLTPVLREVHAKIITPWWNAYGK